MRDTYQRMPEVLKRLQGTHIKTDTGRGVMRRRGSSRDSSEAWLHYVVTRTNKTRLKVVELRLFDWLYCAIRDRHVLDHAHLFPADLVGS